MTDLSRKSVDVWADKVLEVSKSLPEGQKFLVLHHFSGQYVTMTPYLKARAEQMKTQALSYYSAIVLPRSGIVQLMTTFLQKMHRDGATRFFNSREEGLAWLQQIS